MERIHFRKYFILILVIVSILFISQCKQTKDESEFIQFVRFQKVTLHPVIDAERSDEYPSLIFGEIVEILETKNDTVKVRSFISEKEGWLSKHFLTSDKHEIDYLKEINLFPKYLLISHEGISKLTSLTDMSVKVDDQGSVKIEWEEKGFSFFVESGSMERFQKTEIGKKCNSIRSNTLFVFDGETFLDLSLESSKHYSIVKYKTSQEDKIQSLINDNKWYMRFKKIPISNHSKDKNSYDSLYFGEELELLDWNTKSDELLVRSVSSGREVWSNRYYITPNKYEIDFLKEKKLLPVGGLLYCHEDDGIITYGALFIRKNGKFALYENDGCMTIFDGKPEKQNEFCIEKNIPYNEFSFSFYVHDGNNMVEVMPMALKLFRQEEKKDRK